MVCNIRGTSGSGKTTVVRGLMAKGVVAPLGTNPKKPEAYRVDIPELNKPLYVIGSYENTCGGCDQIQTQDEICNRVRVFAPAGHVVLEGLLMSHSFARYASLDREMNENGIPCIWAFLDTPLEVCLDRVRARREERRLAQANPPAFKELNTKNTVDKWNDGREVYEKFLAGRSEDWKLVRKFGKDYPAAKLDARWLDHTNAVKQVFEWLAAA